MSVLQALTRAIDAYVLPSVATGPHGPKPERPSLLGLKISPEHYVVLLTELHVQGKTPQSVRVREVEITPSDFAACIRGDAPWCPHCRHDAHATRVTCGVLQPTGGQCPCVCRITADRHGYLERSSDGHCITFGGVDRQPPGAKPPTDAKGKPVPRLLDGPLQGPLPAASPR